jgi:hypothetical protein
MGQAETTDLPPLRGLFDSCAASRRQGAARCSALSATGRIPLKRIMELDG